MMSDQPKEFEQYDDEKNWARLIHIAKKHLDIWTHHNIQPAGDGFKLSYMPLIFNVNLKGNTNTEIAKKSLIAKQAMSRTVKELEEKGMIVSEPAKNDKRSYTINLTDTGKSFVLDASQKMTHLVDEYKALVGEEEFKTAVDVLSKIIRYHEQANIQAEE